MVMHITFKHDVRTVSRVCSRLKRTKYNVKYTNPTPNAFIYVLSLIIAGFFYPHHLNTRCHKLQLFLMVHQWVISFIFAIKLS